MTSPAQQTVSLTINKKPIQVPQGTTIMEAAKMAGVHIPHFCWHPGLSVAGVCRFCMVKIEGNPKLQIGCNTTVSEGMKVDTVSEDVKEAHKWALEFHLINHPLDCPICDQAGECELQNSYMKVGKYPSQMTEQKVLKPKALDVGKTLVLDTERCILCSRCVRFEDEVTKTATLGIFNRGDQAVIGTYPGRKIEHNYSYNLADICPVGAFTSKDFRFKCRVWFLKETKSICPGCSTGCNVTVFQNKEQREYFRLKPRENPDVNGHWMCDLGRLQFEHVNAKNRLPAPLVDKQRVDFATLKTHLDTLLKDQTISKVALILTPQYTIEEYETILTVLKNVWSNKLKTYIWRDAQENREDFDGLLLSGDRNPNSAGLASALEKLETKAHLIAGKWDEVSQENFDLAFVFSPENSASYLSYKDDLPHAVKSAKKVVWFGNDVGAETSPHFETVWMRIPTLTFVEKDGHYINYKGVKQKLSSNPAVYPSLLSIEKIFAS